MEELKYKNKILYYETIKTDKDPYLVIIKDDLVIINVPLDAKKETIEKVLMKKFDYFYYRTHKDEMKETVHYKGITYKVKCVKGKKDNVKIKDDMIIVTSIKNEKRYYQAVLRRFYKRTVEEELTKLIFEAQNDFKEIVFPKIKVIYMSGYFGYYTKTDNVVKLSPILAKYDPIYIKVVLYHELTHAIEISHTSNFFITLDKKFPGAVKLDDTLKWYKYDDYI